MFKLRVLVSVQQDDDTQNETNHNIWPDDIFKMIKMMFYFTENYHQYDL